MKRDIFAQLRAVGFDIHMHRETPRIDEWYVTTPAGNWGPFPDMLQALVEGVRLLIGQQNGEEVAKPLELAYADHLPHVHLDGLKHHEENAPYTVSQSPSGDYIVYRYQEYMVTFRRMISGETPDLNYASIVKYDGIFWITATQSDFEEWVAISEQDDAMEPSPDLGVFGQFLESLDRGEQHHSR